MNNRLHFSPPPPEFAGGFPELDFGQWGITVECITVSTILFTNHER